jgi:ketosteroid isomerase-like protein
MSDGTTVANRLFDAIEGGDIDTIESLYHADALIWHNTDDTAKPREDTMQLVAWMIENMPPTKYVDRHVSATEDGFVSRHYVIITDQDGGEVRLPCCMVATLSDGQITHVYEYFDSAAQSQTGIAVSSD